MQVFVRGQGIELTEDVRERAERSLGFALGRFSPRIERVTVRLVDMNGPRGGVDKRCRIEVKLRSTGRVLIEEIAPSLQRAIDRAADRAARATDRSLKRRREPGPLLAVRRR